ncbi:hypothetical protein, partial [Chryseobacterium sp. IT-36CA2]|uniref:hypothetical protein n=1 Tax=Chryseobacterium sp. IT-36CA2 TaxID=3026460 RepID=UPI0039DF2EDA
MKKEFLFIIFFVMNLTLYNAQQYTIKQIDSLISCTEKVLADKNDSNIIVLSNRDYKISQKANYPEG